jgi:hypothetical protein
MTKQLIEWDALMPVLAFSLMLIAALLADPHADRAEVTLFAVMLFTIL